jgi:DNA-binding NtrC family response regulator
VRGFFEPDCPFCLVKLTTMATSRRVLILDDDPSHLDIYGMMVERAGFASIPVLVRFTGPDPIPDSTIDLVLLDYRLNSLKTAPEIAQEIRSKFPEAPIILLSDLWSPPADVAPYITQFVRKGDPAKLMDVLRSHLSGE